MSRHWTSTTMTAGLMLLCGMATAAEPVQFNRDIRPILADRCFACHGPDKDQLQAELRLDLADSATADRDGKPAIVPGQPEQSELLRRLLTDDEEMRMPPPDSGKPLSKQEISLVSNWIAQGAEYQRHWSLIPPQRPAVPQVQAGATAIDQFILARLGALGVDPAPIAAPRTLIRRLYFDLIGLPPSPQAVEIFANDPSAEQYERVVDGLLDSQHFGERLALYWLDLVRYADSIGYHSDNVREVSLYRDYVISAFNSNTPFDTFTIENLAGDLLPKRTNQQWIASGYNRLLQTTQEGGGQAKEYLAKYAADRVRNVSSVWLGATMGCSECHDHKFDAFTMKDFYSLAAFFADLTETPVGRQQPTPIPVAEHEQRLAELDSLVTATQQTLDTQTPELNEHLATWEAKIQPQLDQLAIKLGTWHSLGPFAAASFDEAHANNFGPEAGVDLARTYQEEKIKWTAQAGWKDGQVISLKGDNSATYAFRTITTSVKTALPVELGSDDSIKIWLNEQLVLDKKVKRGVAAGQEKLTLQLAEGENRLLLKVANASGGYGFIFQKTGSGLPDNVLAILKTPGAERNEKQQAELAKYYRSVAPSLDASRKQLAELKKKREAITKSFPTTLVSIAREPRMMRVLPRGNWLDDSGPEVAPQTPAILGTLDVGDRRATRLDLAHWIVDRQNPLTSRVFVNRLWKLYFGYGLARTLDDLGVQGQWPTHPELLDWLAVEFIDNGWDIKRMVKTLVMSRSYQQDSRPTPALRERDPFNQWYARQSRWRLDAELVRDNALAVSGLLVNMMGGKSVKPYQPAGYWAHLNFPQRKWQKGAGTALYRRGLYTHWQRTFLHPSLVAFDAPAREECTAERPRSNTPQQALVLLNDPSYVEAARVFAERIVKHGGATPTERIDWAFREALSRQPTDKERTVLLQLLDKHMSDYKADQEAANALLKVGDQTVKETPNPVELAAWTSLARVVFNLHEIITRY